ncbi:DUF6093 family protein [Nonomuraea sp. NPDC003804]|uniref:DUF6093 family protein n=1 Tax=Nonomuraea sp. NPDC003804 TaxID=3154547 RepID=UPI0033A09EE2
MPLAGHGPVPARWSEHHRPVASGTHTATCAIRRQTGEGGIDDDGVWHPPTFTVVYTGPCRIIPQPTDARIVVSGEQQVSLRSYDVAIEWDAANVFEGDHLTVTSGQDPRIAGLELLVTDVRLSGETWERVLACQANLTEEA